MSANVSENRGFVPHGDPKTIQKNPYFIDTSQATKRGDVIRMNTTGKVRGTTAGTALLAVGVQVGGITSPSTGAVRDTSNSVNASAGDFIMVYDDPNQVFLAKTSSYTLTDPYTTRLGSLCFDEAGSAGAQYVATSLSTLDTFKSMGPDNNFQNGFRSTTGANATVRYKFNLNKHIYGHSGVTT